MKLSKGKWLKQSIVLAMVAGAWGMAMPVEAGAPIHDSTTLMEDKVINQWDTLSGGSKTGSGLYVNRSGYDRQNPMKVDMNGHNLSIQLKAEKGSPIVTGIYLTNNSHLAISNATTDKKLSISVENGDTTAANAIKMLSHSGLRIQGPVEIHDIVSAGRGASGILFQGKVGEIVIDGTLKMTSVYGKNKRSKGLSTTGINLTGDDSRMTVTGAVDISGVEGSSLYTQGADTVLTVGGGTITTPDDPKKENNYYAAYVGKGTININVKDKNPGDMTTKIKGDMYIIGQYGKRVVEYSGGELASWKHEGHLNVALTDKDSFWTGVAAYDQYNDDYGSGGNTMHDIGDFTLYLQNGATWTNEAQAHVGLTSLKYKNPVYEGSTIMHFFGGESPAKKGMIYQKEEKPITFINYKGHALVYYDHEGDGSTADKYKAGDIRIKKAEDGSSITLRTGAEGINTADDATVAKVLDSLAHKLQYMTYQEGDTKLQGKVEIAEGLTASSISKKGDITFVFDGNEKKNGFGSYVYVPTEKYNTTILGIKEHDKAYVDNHIRQEDDTYKFTKDTTIEISEDEQSYESLDGPENSEFYEQNGRSVRARAGVLAGVNETDEAKQIHLDAKEKELGINVNLGQADMDDDLCYGGGLIAVGNNTNKASIVVDAKTLKIKVPSKMLLEGARADIPVGIAADSGSQITVNGNVDMEGPVVAIDTGRFSDETENKVVIQGDLSVSKSFIGARVGGGHSSIIVTGKTDILPCDEESRGDYKGQGEIVGLHIQNDSYELRDDSFIAVGGGTIDRTGEWAAVAEGGTIYINTGEKGTKQSTATLTGDMKATKKGKIKVALTDKNSSWTGAVETEEQGMYDLSLAKGAIWNHRKEKASDKFAGSYVKTFAGGEAGQGGYIYQKDEKPITIENYSGETSIVYAHKKDNPKEMIGGDTIIQEAKAGSMIHLITDGQGLKTGSSLAKDKNQVSETLQGLAKKLYYKGYLKADTKENLKGTVEIAEGLTSSSVTTILRKEDMTFDDGTGQGNYAFTPEKEDPNAQKTSDFTVPITGDSATNQAYVDANVLKDNAYTFKNGENQVKVGDAAVSEDTLGYYRAVAAVRGDKKDIEVKAEGKSISLESESTNKEYGAYGIYTQKQVAVTAKDILISSVSQGRSAEGIKVTGGGSVTLTGDVHIKSKHKGDDSAYGIDLYNGGNSLTVNGNLDMKGTDDDLYGVSTAEKGGYSTKEYRATGIYIYDSTGSTLLVNGKADIYVKGVGVDIRGSKKNKVTLASGTIYTPEDMNESSYKAIAATMGTFSMGMKDGNTGANGKDVVIHGKVNVGDGGQVYLGLGTASSQLVGVVDPYENGVAELYLEKGATWKNRLTMLDGLGFFKGSHLTKLVGGANTDDRGVIIQNNEKDITIDTYSGHTLVLYDHDKNASRDATPGLEVIGGNIIIKNAKAGSEITLRTDSKGLKPGSDKEADKNLVNATLNNLANKLFYTAYKTGEMNLKGHVEIAEGLTASAMKKRLEDMTFKKENGQGQYSTTPSVEPTPDPGSGEEPTPPAEEGEDVEYTDPITGIYGGDGKYDAGDAKTFGKDIVTMPDKTKERELSYDFTKQKSTTITVEWGSAARMTAGGKLTIKAKKLRLIENGEQEMDMVGGLVAPGGGTVDMTGDLEIQVVGKENSTTGLGSYNGGSSGASGQSIFDIHGNLTMRNQDEANPWGIYNTGAIHGNYKKEGYTGSRWAPVGINLGTGAGSRVTVDGTVDLAVKGIAVATDPFYATEGMDDYDLAVVNLKGGRIITPKYKTEGYYSLANFGGTININMNDAKDDAADHDVEMVGNIISMKESIDGEGKGSGGSYFYRDGRINLGLSTEKSSWTGVIDNTGKDQAGEVNIYLKNKAQWNYEAVGKVNGLDAEHMPIPSNAHYGIYDGVSHVNRLAGGTSDDTVGVIVMKDKADMNVVNYSGHTLVIYDHVTTAARDAIPGLNMIGGNIIINKAEAGSEITLRTDNKGLNTDSDKAADWNLVSATLNNLANKLFYTAYKDGERNLKGKVEIAEGLTASSKGKRLEDMTFKEADGQGQYLFTEKKDEPNPKPDPGDKPVPPVEKTGAEKFFDLWKSQKGNENKGMQEFFDSLKDESTFDLWKGQEGNDAKVPKDFYDNLKDQDLLDLWKKLKGNETKGLPELDEFLTGTKDNLIRGAYETRIMKAAKSSMTTTMLAMRDSISSMVERVGDLRMNGDDGIWARTYGGKSTYKKNNTDFSATYNGIQVGADKKLESGWHAGIALDYQTGNATYELGGSGDPKLYTLGLYGTKTAEDGSYIDVVAKVGKGENNYTVYNSSHDYLKGNYKASAYGVSVEYGKKIEQDGFYLEPQMQISYMKLQGADYDATSNFNGGTKVNIKQAGMNSVIGRIGLAVGKQMKNTNLYAKVGLLHEFAGDTKNTFHEEGMDKKVIKQSFNDSWVELMLGINHQIDQDKQIYADIGTGLGGDYKQDWKANAGLRMRF